MATRRRKQTYQLKITLKGTKLPIWRRILVPSDIRLDDLHMVGSTTCKWYSRL